MSSINFKLKPTQRVTYEGAAAYSITPMQQLRRSVMSCLLWESEFYEDGKSISKRICELVTQCSVDEVAALAIEAKTQMRLRHVPLLLARELCRSKEG